VIKLAQRQGIDDRGAALDRRAIRGACGKSAARKQDNGGTSRGRDHASTNTARLCLFKRKALHAKVKRF
jgi:hypothetical protein